MSLKDTVAKVTQKKFGKDVQVVVDMSSQINDPEIKLLCRAFKRADILVWYISVSDSFMDFLRVDKKFAEFKNRVDYKKKKKPFPFRKAMYGSIEDLTKYLRKHKVAFLVSNNERVSELVRAVKFEQIIDKIRSM